MEILQSLLTYETLFWVISGLLGILIAKTSIEFIADIKDIFDALKRAVEPEGPGGKKITPEETEEIKDEVFDLVYKVWDKHKNTILSKIGIIVGKLKFW